MCCPRYFFCFTLRQDRFLQLEDVCGNFIFLPVPLRLILLKYHAPPLMENKLFLTRSGGKVAPFGAFDLAAKATSPGFGASPTNASKYPKGYPDALLASSITEQRQKPTTGACSASPCGA